MGGTCQPVHGGQGPQQQDQPVQQQPAAQLGEQRVLHGPHRHGHQHPGRCDDQHAQPGPGQRLHGKTLIRTVLDKLAVKEGPA